MTATSAIARRFPRQQPALPPVERGMHFYIYDEALSRPKFANTLADIETRLTDLELSGRVGRLGPLKSGKEMVRQAIRAGASTIVAVGGDRTIAEAVNAIQGTGVTLGVVPVDEDCKIAKLMGIPIGESACVVLAARKIERVDLGKVNNLYFLTSLTIKANSPVTLECDERYRVTSPQTSSTIIISNLRKGSNCQDGYLEVMIESENGGWFSKDIKKSTIPFKLGRVIPASDNMMANVEGAYTVKLPTIVEVIPRALKIIVGKERAF